VKLVRYGTPGRIRPGLIDDHGEMRDLSGWIQDLTISELTPSRFSHLLAINPGELAVVEEAEPLAAPIADLRNVYCVGLNYRDHAEELGLAIPEAPVLFQKSGAAIAGPEDQLVLPPGSTTTDWEVELAAVISRPGRDIPVDQALGHVAGYMILNDVTERALQAANGGQWFLGKSCDGFAPVGPCLVGTRMVPDPQVLDLWLDVNGERQQTGSTATMIFSVAECIAFLSRHLTLVPGDVISTGTPPGVGHGQTPPRYLKPGDVVTAGITNLGEQRFEVVAPD